MMRTLKQRVLATLTATLVAAVCGMLAAFLAGSGIILRSAEKKLGQDSIQLLREIGAILNEAHSVLGTMNASQAPFCSDGEVSAFRKLIFHSEFLRDAGRIHDGRIQCSAALGRENLPLTQFKPAAVFPDGSMLYQNLSPYQSDKGVVFGEQIGDSFAVLDPHELRRLDAINGNRLATVIDAVSHQLRHPVLRLPVVDGVVYDRNWQGIAGGFLLATRCAPRYPICMTTYIAIPELARKRGGQLTAYVSLGGMLGALFGFVCSLIYRRNRSMEQQLRRAIASDTLKLVYQPIVNLASRRIVGAESLARWTDEEGFAVGPDVFVKLAEERGFVGLITELVVRHALRDFAKILSRHPGFRLSINVTAADLADAKFVPMLERAVKHAHFPAENLAIEITESSAVRYQTAIETIVLLRKQGYSVHIDDFGTGYSSLSYLHDLAVDAIKIDKAFTQAIGTGSVIVAILPQIVAIAEALNLEVIVEGVETEEQAGYFANGAGQILAQGWLFGYPVPAGEFHRMLSGGEKKPSLPVDAA